MYLILYIIIIWYNLVGKLNLIFGNEYNMLTT